MDIWIFCIPQKVWMVFFNVKTAFINYDIKKSNNENILIKMFPLPLTWSLFGFAC